MTASSGSASCSVAPKEQRGDALEPCGVHDALAGRLLHRERQGLAGRDDVVHRIGLEGERVHRARNERHGLVEAVAVHATQDAPPMRRPRR